MLLLAPMAEEVGADPTSPVLETGAFAAMLLLNVCFSCRSVPTVKRLSALPAELLAGHPRVELDSLV